MEIILIIKKVSSIPLIVLLCLTFSCQSAQENKLEVKSESSPIITKTVEPKELKHSIDVSKLVNKSATELDKTFGEPEKITPAAIAKEMPGEYRLYKMADHPKGLSVRFYKDKAVRFNLILGTPEKSASQALLKNFNIDVSKMTSVKGESLSETWKGNFNGVNFSTAYAKREKAGSEFIMIHAEIAQ